MFYTSIMTEALPIGQAGQNIFNFFYGGDNDGGIEEESIQKAKGELP